MQDKVAKSKIDCQRRVEIRAQASQMIRFFADLRE
jgi:hypothetical protein